jgi:hypothetical protein
MPAHHERDHACQDCRTASITCPHDKCPKCGQNHSARCAVRKATRGLFITPRRTKHNARPTVGTTQPQHSQVSNRYDALSAQETQDKRNPEEGQLDMQAVIATMIPTPEECAVRSDDAAVSRILDVAPVDEAKLCTQRIRPSQELAITAIEFFITHSRDCAIPASYLSPYSFYPM